VDLTALQPAEILVIKLKHIGDLLVMVPALRALKAHWPEARLTVLLNSGMGELIEGLPYIDELIYFDRVRIKGNWHAERDFLKDIRAREFDLAIDFTGGERSAWYCWLSGAAVRVGVDDRRGFPGRRLLYHKLLPWGPSHYVNNHLEIIAPLGIKNAALDMEIAISDQVRKSALAKISSLTDSYCILHPTSRWMFKSWPVISCQKTILGLQSLGLPVVITSGPEKKEKQLVAKIIAGLPNQNGVIDLSGQTTLPELAALISNGKLFLGVDSAPLHIASATGTPAVVLFGPSGVYNWGPWQIPHRVVTAGRDCSPCGKDGCRGSKRSDCLEELKAEQILQTIAELLEEIEK